MQGLSGKPLLNSFLNMSGGAVPALIGLLLVPYIVKQLGDDNYGLLTLATSIIGYFALLDINATSASVKFLAEHNARGERHEMCEVLSFGAIVYIVIGLSGAILIYSLAEMLTQQMFSISIDLEPIAVRTLKIAALGFFFGQLQTYLNSIPQALSRFDVTAGLEWAFGIGIPLVTVGLLWLGYGLVEVVIFRVLTSVFNVLALLVIVFKLIPDIKWVQPSPAIARKVGVFSGYAYMSRIAAVTYNHADKLIIGSVVNMAGLTYYTVSSTLVNRLLGLTFRMASVLYPVASELDAVKDRERLRRLYLLATSYLTYINTFFVLMISSFSYSILYWWIGEEFARQGQWIMVMIAIALLIDSLTNVPSLFNDGLGYPKHTGLFALGRALVGVVLLLVLTRQFGILGAALGNLIASILVTTAFLVFIHRKTIPVTLSHVIRHCYAPSISIAGGCGLLIYFIGDSQSQDWVKSIELAGLMTALYLSLGFVLVVEPAHRHQIHLLCRRLIRRAW